MLQWRSVPPQHSATIGLFLPPARKLQSGVAPGGHRIAIINTNSKPRQRRIPFHGGICISQSADSDCPSRPASADSRTKSPAEQENPARSRHSDRQSRCAPAAAGLCDQTGTRRRPFDGPERSNSSDSLSLLLTIAAASSQRTVPAVCSTDPGFSSRRTKVRKRDMRIAIAAEVFVSKMDGGGVPALNPSRRLRHFNQGMRIVCAA